MWGASLPLGIAAALLLMLRLPAMMRHERSSSYVEHILHFLLALPFIVLLSRFIIADTSYLHVWLYGGVELPIRYRIAAIWASREGPLLLWAAWLALVTWAWRRPRAKETESQHVMRLRLLHGANLTLLLIALTMDPFERNSAPDWMGASLTPLLQTDLMVIHPPLVFLFYSLCMAVGAVALSSILVTSADSPGLKERLLEPARPALLVGTLAIGLGGLWAYLVLNWGGYWAWDPVETGSLLPWLAVIILMHLPLRPGKVSDGIWTAAGLVVGGLAVFATLVTRASGVWASSLHSFVGNTTGDDGSVPTDVWGRIMVLREDVVTGVEVMTYLLILGVVMSIWIGWMLARRLGAEVDSRIPFTLLALPGPVVIALLWSGLNGEDVAIWSGISSWAIAILCISPVLLYCVHLWAGLLGRLGGDPLRLPMLIGSLVVGFWVGDVILGMMGFMIVLMVASHRTPESAAGWIASGLLFHLCAAWAQLATIMQSAAGMAILLIPIFLVQPEDEEATPLGLSSRKGQMRLVLSAPSTLVSAFLLLSWLLLLNSLDRTQLESHELLGAPIIAMCATALMVYGWRNRVDSEKVPWLVLGLILVSALLAGAYGDALPGDVDDAFSGTFTRGSLAWILLPALLLTLPSIGLELSSKARRWWAVRSAGRRGSRKALRGMAAHLVHLGLVILMIGHVFSTVLVDRASVEHRLSLDLDEPTIDGGFAYVYRELVIISKDTPEFNAMFDVGEGYIGVVIDIHDHDETAENGMGERLGTVQPGVLRFDDIATPARSEVDTLSGFSGDLVVIFDGGQADALGQAMSSGDPDSMQRIRITAYDLPGSHLVWLGWSMMLLGLSLVWQDWWGEPSKPSKKEEE